MNFVLLCCLAGPTIAALALWIAGRLAPRWQPGTAGIMVGSLTVAVALAALKPLGGWHPGLSLALAAGCGAATGVAYIRLAPLRLFATFLSPALVVVPAVHAAARRRRPQQRALAGRRVGRHDSLSTAPAATAVRRYGRRRVGVATARRGVGARMRAGLRASNRRARHLPMRYETGLPSSVIRFRT